MGRFTTIVDVDRPLHEVFDFLADRENDPSWHRAVESVVPLDETPPHVGSSYRVERSLPSGRAVNTVAVTELEAPRLLTIETASGPTPFRYRFELRPMKRGTELSLDGEITVDGFFDLKSILDPVAAISFRRKMKRNLLQLKHLLESGSVR